MPMNQITRTLLPKMTEMFHSKEASMNKTIAVKNHLEAKGSITTFEAINLFGATRLSAIIFNLRRRGMDIQAITTIGLDRYGSKVRYAKYTYTAPVNN